MKPMNERLNLIDQEAFMVVFLKLMKMKLSRREGSRVLNISSSGKLQKIPPPDTVQWEIHGNREVLQ